MLARRGGQTGGMFRPEDFPELTTPSARTSSSHPPLLGEEGNVERAPAPPPAWFGGLKSPAGMSSAIVIVVLGSESDFTLAHGVGANAVTIKTTARLPIIL